MLENFVTVYVPANQCFYALICIEVVKEFFFFLKIKNALLVLPC